MPPLNAAFSYPRTAEAQSIDPLGPIEHLLQTAAGAAVETALGLLLGLIAARVMRHRHLHWSWAGVGLGCVALVHGPLGDSALVLGAGAFSAAARGRRWHREDLEAGADLAEIARERRRPLDALRAAGHIARVRLAGAGLDGALAAGGSGSSSACAGFRRDRWFDRDELQLGTDGHGRAVSIALGGESGGTHTLVVGATGSGKTVTQAWIAAQAIAHGMGAVIVDPKGDGALREVARRAAQAAGRRFVEWTPAGPCVYNPCARGSDTEIADRVLAAERYTEPHYQRQAQRYLGHATRVLRRAGLEVSLARLVRMLDPDALEVLARQLPHEEALDVHAYLDSLTSRHRSDLTGIRDRLAIVVESDVGPWLDPETSRGECFDLLAALRERAVVYIGLEADSRPLLAQMLGSAIVLDLQTAVSAMQGRPVAALVLIDEFSALAAQHVARLFGRARSAGISLLLATQELSDLRLPGSEHLLEQVLGNLTSLIAHRQVVPDSAELIARLAGTRGAWSTSWNRDGRGTRKRMREYLLAPDQVKSLPRGHAAVIRLTGRAHVAITRVLPPGAQF
jgi:Type IV secretion-system coupling protein DNA-binding domain